MGVIRKCQVFFQFLCNFFSGILGVYVKSVAFAIAWFTRLPEFSRKLKASKEETVLDKQIKRVHLVCNAHIDPIWQWD